MQLPLSRAAGKKADKMHALTRAGGRLLQIVPTVLLVALLMFALMRLLPGDAAVAMLGDRATDESLARLRHEMGYDQSFAVQLLNYIEHVATLRFGESVSMHVPVTRLIIDRLPITLMLTAMAAVLAIVMAVPLAFAAALNEGGIADAIIRLFCQVGLSMPVFYLGLILLITLAAGLGWFPVGGIGDHFTQDLYYLFLPALTLALSLGAILMRNLRDALIGVLHAEFVQFATAKGLLRRVVLGRHVLRNAIVSTVTLLGLNIGSLVGGAVITESVFAIPGVGRLMIDSIFARDYPVVQGLTIMLAVLVSLVFIAVDTLQATLDPRMDA
jgi:peptide/nickel transport system permease protein